MLAPVTPTPYVMHVRLTKACNADCSYCSSWQGARIGDYMNAQEYRQCLDNLMSLWDQMDIAPDYITINYIGGEVLTIPTDELEEIANTAREVLKARGAYVRDGIQTNLIASQQRIDEAHRIFDGSVSTSIDHCTDQRTINGSPTKYRTIFMKRDEDLAQTRSRVPAVVVIDGNNASHIHEELRIAQRQQRTLTLRPVFHGGSTVDPADKDRLVSTVNGAFDRWFMRMAARIEPFHGMVTARLDALEGTHTPTAQDGCNFQSNCALRSIDIEPNGDFYLCVEMADMGKGYLGNGLNGSFDWSAWGQIMSRDSNLDPTCQQCPFLRQCRGGCMAQAIDAGLGYYGRPPLCESWTHIFRTVDDYVAREGAEPLRRWLNVLEER